MKGLPAILQDFDEILLALGQKENCQHEMFFSSNMIDYICKVGNYNCYRFAFNQYGDSYMRLRTRTVTLEYIIIKDSETQDDNSYVHQIFVNGQLIYRRPDTPSDTISISWKKID